MSRDTRINRPMDVVYGMFGTFLLVFDLVVPGRRDSMFYSSISAVLHGLEYPPLPLSPFSAQSRYNVV